MPEDRDYYKEWLSALSGSSAGATGSAQAEPTPPTKTDYYSQWQSELGPPPPEQPSWLQSTAENIVKKNSFVQALMIGSNNPMLQAVAKSYHPELQKSVDLAKAFENLRSQAREFAHQAGMYTPQEVASPDFGYRSVMEGIGPGGVSEKGPGLPEKALGLATFFPNLVGDLVVDPAKTIQERPLDLIFMAEGFAGPKLRLRLKSAAAKMKIGTLSQAELSNIFRDISKEAPSWEAPKEVKDSFSRLSNQEDVGTVYGSGGEVLNPTGKPQMTFPVPQPKEVATPGIETAEGPLGRQVPGLMAQFVDEQGRPISMAQAITKKKAVTQPLEDIVVASGGKSGQPEPTPEVQPGGQAPTTTPPITAADTFMSALKKAPLVRGKQEAMYSAERAERFGKAIAVGKEVGGEAGYRAQLGSLSGELQKAHFEGIRSALGETPEARQSVVDALFQQVQDSPAISEIQKISTKDGLAKLLGEGGGVVPQEQQLVYLNKVFGDEFVRTIMEKRSAFQRMKQLGLEVANVPRAVMASTDLSFGLRQGLMMAAGHPVIFWRNWIHQFNKGGKTSFKAVGEEIVQRPTYPLMDKYGLALTDVGEVIKMREEQFASPLAERIPLIGKVVGWSNRVYTAFANKLRADVFDYYVKRSGDIGRDVWSNNFDEWMHKKGMSPVGMDEAQLKDLRTQFGKDIKLGHDIAKIVNNGTGRGTFGKRMEDLAPAMNAMMFSPRLFASRFNTLLNPGYYMKLDPFARKAQLKMTLSMVGAGVTTLGLLKQAGVEVGVNPTSADFGKIKLGNTRIDIWGGYQQYAVLSARMLTGQTSSSTTDRATSITKGGFGSPNRMTILSNFFQGKLSPIPAFAVAMMQGQNVMGEKFDVTKGLDQSFASGEWMKNPIASMFIPMVINDLADIAKDDPSLIPASALGVFGVGLQTYEPTPKKKRVY